jgi:NADPH-dependent ferric siderophore reductase
MIRALHKTEVVNVLDVSPHIRRITLGGGSLADFPEGYESGYVKLMFPQEGEDAFSDSIVGGLIRGNKPRVRSYTILAHDEATSQLTLDFVIHGDNGPASAWASRAQIGDAVTLRGPGGTKLMKPSADWFFLAGDLSALPALSVNLQRLPRDATGYACIEIISAEDKIKLDAPPGIKLSWVINPRPDVPNSILIDAIRLQPWLIGNAEVWFAGEFDAMRAARRYFKQERGVVKGHIYASSYWKIGATDESNKIAKRKESGK